MWNSRVGKLCRVNGNRERSRIQNLFSVFEIPEIYLGGWGRRESILQFVHSKPHMTFIECIFLMVYVMKFPNSWWKWPSRLPELMPLHCVIGIRWLKRKHSYLRNCKCCQYRVISVQSSGILKRISWCILLKHPNYWNQISLRSPVIENMTCERNQYTSREGHISC